VPTIESPGGFKRWELPIIPKAHNRMKWKHWTAAYGEKARWQTAVMALPPGPWPGKTGVFSNSVGLARVQILLLVFRWRKTQDPTNVRASVKELEDALVTRGWAVDDTEEWLDLRVKEEAVKHKRDQRTVILWRIAP